jgi:hypothetical protein
LTTLLENSIVISCPHLLGRLGNYLYNIAFCTKILFELKSLEKKWNKYLYFPCEFNGGDGHGHTDIFNYNNSDSYHLSIFKYDKIDEFDNISSITNYLNIDESILKHISTKQRYILSNMCNYNIIFEAFPIIIETFICEESIIIHLNNMLYEGLDLPDLTKNLYLSNDDITKKIIKHIQFVIHNNIQIKYIFIKMDFALISSHLAFQSESFNNYFTKKIFGYQIKDQPARKYIEDIYNDSKLLINKNKSLFVAMHFRGGDYGNPAQQAEYYAVLGPQYYIDCMIDIYLKNQDSDIYFVMFCSPVDLEYVEQIYIPYISKYIIIKNINLLSFKKFLGKNIINDQLNIYLMGLFDYLCLSNSTYSWWSCYFSHLYKKENFIYASSIYKYPKNILSFNKLYLKFKKGNEEIIQNNYIINIYAWYGISSSIYTYLLFSELIDNIIKLDMETICDTILKKYFVIMLKIMKKSELINLDEEIKVNIIINSKNNNKDKIIEINKILFIDRQNIFTLEIADKIQNRIKIQKINEIMCTLDRGYTNYKNSNIIDSIYFI